MNIERSEQPITTNIKITGHLDYNGHLWLTRLPVRGLACGHLMEAAAYRGPQCVYLWHGLSRYPDICDLTHPGAQMMIAIINGYFLAEVAKLQRQIDETEYHDYAEYNMRVMLKKISHHPETARFSLCKVS